MELALTAAAVVAGLFLGMLLFAEVGRRIGLARLARDPDGLERGAGAAAGALFALLGLLIAFTFSAAASRFEDRKQLILQETNAIGTAWLRLDLLPEDHRTGLRQLFLGYLDHRIGMYRDITDPAANEAAIAHTAQLQAGIWTAAVAALRDSPPQSTIMLVPALNEMIDITTTRVMAAYNHTPLIVFLLLSALSFLAAMLVGYDTSPNPRRGWFHTMVFAAIVAVTVYVIVDLEFPRIGLIRVDATDQLLVELRDSLRAG